MYDYTRAHTGTVFAAWMRGLAKERRFTTEGCDILCVHGSPLGISDFLWESLDDDELLARLDAIAPTRPDVLLCTHTGLPWSRRVGGTLLVNVGAIRRPANDGRTDVWFAVVDCENGAASARLEPLAYDWRAQAASMRAVGLPEPFVETIETGWWTTCLEIVAPVERAHGRYHVYREQLPTGFALDGAGWTDATAPTDAGLPVISLFDSALFPARLWVYTNFHCNLACAYCVVQSSRKARARQLDPGRFRALVDEAIAAGFTEIYLTGGEPFVPPDLVAMVEYAAARLDTVVLTNAMLFTGRRRRELQRLAALPRLVLQSSLDGSNAERHDAWRGLGSWQRALDGLRYAASLGLPLRVAMTETPENHGDVAATRALLEPLGITGDAFAARPLVARGFAAGTDGLRVSDAVMVPEPTVTTDGVHWHPVGADVDASPDFLIAPGELPLAEAKRLVIERFLRLRQADGSLPAAFQCAI